MLYMVYLQRLHSHFLKYWMGWCQAYGGLLKEGHPQIIHFNGILHYKPTIFGATPLFGTHPYLDPMVFNLAFPWPCSMRWCTSCGLRMEHGTGARKCRWADLGGVQPGFIRVYTYQQWGPMVYPDFPFNGNTLGITNWLQFLDMLSSNNDLGLQICWCVFKRVLTPTHNNWGKSWAD